ncbi:hypothetical protein J3Q64DRAFT_1843534 [Phycomyces blakesleeanus]|uniref:B30.2/SPRY domain-containing protein n=1 Tax=Phycomyces blakesleeanus TaxID=4837 RepID=A0ABR3BDF8_PHYBL
MSSPTSYIFDFPARSIEARRPRALTQIQAQLLTQAQAQAQAQAHVHAQAQTRSASRRAKTSQELLENFMERYANGLPSYPSYLKGTVYEQLIQEQYMIYCEKRSGNQEETRSHSQQQTNSLPKAVAHYCRPTILPPPPPPPPPPPHSQAQNEQQIMQQLRYQNLRIHHQQIHYYQQQRQQPPPPPTPSIQPLRTPTTVSQPAQDSLTERLIANDLHLPSAWNPDERGEFVEMSEDHLQLSYEGIGEKDSDIAAVRANYPMRYQCGIYYFEVEIISKGVDGHIGIGFCWPSSKLNRLPGWEVHSWGYHGDDGHIFSGPETSKNYGPTFGTGDIIGCGVDFRDMTAFYTKNGVHLGTAFKNITGNILYPFVGFKTKGERIRANFGNQPYKYDIHQYIESERIQMQEIVYRTTPVRPHPHPNPNLNLNLNMSSSQKKDKHSIATTAAATAAATTPTPSPTPAQTQTQTQTPTMINDPPAIEEAKSKDVMNALILDYLGYYGYYNTSQALRSTSVKHLGPLIGETPMLVNKVESPDAHIRKALVDGDIEQVIKKCETLYPGVFVKNPQILFRLRCQMFVEMVRVAQGGSGVGHESSKTTNEDLKDTPPTKRKVSEAGLDDTDKDNDDDDDDNIDDTGDDTDDTGDNDNDCNNGAELTQPDGKRRKKKHPSGSETEVEPVVNVAPKGTECFACENTLEKAMVYGEKLKKLYGDLAEDDPERKKTLRAVFSVLAYTNPVEEKTIGYLFSQTHKENLASDLNAVILLHQNYHEVPSLERLYSQLSTTIHELTLEGNGKAAMVRPHQDCL